jgi:hypothetical protein
MPRDFNPSIMPPSRARKEKKEFLEREEIRTMQKDIAKLREFEARGEREKIAALKTEREEREKTERLERLERRAMGRRETTEREAERREEVHEMAEEERRKLETEEKEEEKEKLAGVKRSMEEIQEREEAERRRFLERVQLKGEGESPEIKAETDRLREERERREREEALRKEALKRDREEKEKELRGLRDRFRQREELEPLEKPEEVGAREPEREEAPERFERPKKEFRPPQPQKEVPVAKGKAESTLIPRVVFKKPSLFDKVLIRAIIIVLLVSVFVNLFLFWYWYLKVRETPAVTPSLPSSEETVLPEEEEKEGVPQLTIPASLIVTSSTETIKAANQEETPQLLAQLMEKDFKANSLTRVLIEDTARNKVLGLKEFLAAFGVSTPGDFLDRLNNDFTLFVYSNTKGENRLGFMAKIKEKSGLADLMSAWEPTIEEDTENLYEALGKKGTAPISYFRSAVHKNTTFRYVSFNLPNFGICYSIVGDLLVWTSSGESMIRVIDQL